MKKEIIYQVFVRNYSNEGTFKEVTKNLDQIKELGTTILYLMPINIIGEINRKGTYGSPYASKDYFSISPDLGTLKDLHELIDQCHKKNMKIILDMVFNHTAPDNVLLEQHKDYYFHKNGKVGNRVGDWADIIDLDTDKEEVQTYLISVLKYWLEQGFDGFRFDVCSMIPLSFFKKARTELGNEIIFFGESIDPGFHDYLRSQNEIATNDIDLIPTFNYLYNYNYYRILQAFFRREVGIEQVEKAVQNDAINNYRVNCLENHDNGRVANYYDNLEELKYITEKVFSFPGHIFIWMGQEYGIKHQPDLFSKDPVDWSKKNIEFYEFFKRKIKELS